MLGLAGLAVPPLGKGKGVLLAGDDGDYRGGAAGLMAVRDGGSGRRPGARLITESDVEPGRPAAGSPITYRRPTSPLRSYQRTDRPAMILQDFAC